MSDSPCNKLPNGPLLLYFFQNLILNKAPVLNKAAYLCWEEFINCITDIWILCGSSLYVFLSQ